MLLFFLFAKHIYSFICVPYWYFRKIFCFFLIYEGLLSGDGRVGP